MLDDAEPEPSVDGVLARYARDDLDLIVVEGFKRSSLPKIEVARGALSHELVCAGDPQLIAVVSDLPPPPGVRGFALDDAHGVADLVASLAT